MQHLLSVKPSHPTTMAHDYAAAGSDAVLNLTPFHHRDHLTFAAAAMVMPPSQASSNSSPSTSSAIVSASTSWQIIPLDGVSPPASNPADDIYHTLDSPSLHTIDAHTSPVTCTSPLVHLSPYQHPLPPLVNWPSQQQSPVQDSTRSPQRDHSQNLQPLSSPCYPQAPHHQSHHHQVYHHHTHQPQLHTIPSPGLSHYARDPTLISFNPYSPFPSGLSYLPPAASAAVPLHMDPNTFVPMSAVEDHSAINWNPNAGLVTSVIGRPVESGVTAMSNGTTAGIPAGVPTGMSGGSGAGDVAGTGVGMIIDNWREFRTSLQYDGIPRSLGSSSPASTYLEVLSTGDGWTMLDYTTPFESYDHFDPFQRPQQNPAAIFNPSQTLHLRSDSNSSSTNNSHEFGSYEDLGSIHYPAYSPTGSDSNYESQRQRDVYVADHHHSQFGQHQTQHQFQHQPQHQHQSQDQLQHQHQHQLQHQFQHQHQHQHQNQHQHQPQHQPQRHPHPPQQGYQTQYIADLGPSHVDHHHHHVVHQDIISPSAAVGPIAILRAPQHLTQIGRMSAASSTDSNVSVSGLVASYGSGSASGSVSPRSATSPKKYLGPRRSSPIAKPAAKVVGRKLPATGSKDVTSREKKVGRRRGPLRPEQRKQASEIRKLRACLRCKFLKKTCDTGEPCSGCQPSHARLWQVPCTRVDIKDIAWFMRDWKADHERFVNKNMSVYNVKAFSPDEKVMWITHGYGYALPVMVREVQVADDSCFRISWVEPLNPTEPMTDFAVRTEKLTVGREGVSTQALSDYLEKHIDGNFEGFVDEHFSGTPFVPHIFKTAYRYYNKVRHPVVRKALKFMIAYNLTLHITLIERHGGEDFLTGEIDDEDSKYHGKTIAPTMVNFQIKLALAEMWRELQRDILEELSGLYSSVYSGDRLKNWPTIFILASILMAVWEEIQFDAHYRMRDPVAVNKFCADMETTPVGVIVGLFHAISQKLPSFLEWNTAEHGHVLNDNPAVCDVMTEVRQHVIDHEPYLRSRHEEARYNRRDFDSLSNKFLSKLVIRAN